MEQIAVFVLGLIFGSFANVIVFRLNTGESLIFGGSRCFYCGRNLRWFELIPVVSFLALRGKCRSCGSKISWQYPAVELASGALFLLLWSEPVSLAAFFMSFWLGALLGLLYKFSNRSAGFKTQMPFAPFLSAGGLAAYLWGEKIIFWYLSLL